MPHYARRLGPAARASLAALFVIALAPAARAQLTEAARSREARRVDMETRQRELRDLDKRMSRSPPKVPDARPAHSEVAEEFKQLQVVNYSLAGAADPRVALDYARVRKESAEVRKRATRLKGYLSLPEVEADAKREKAAEIETPEALRSALGQLDKLVNSFVWNPVFQRPGVVDLEESSKAGRDLAGIISLSERIRKSAEELSKSLARR